MNAQSRRVEMHDPPAAFLLVNSRILHVLSSSPVVALCVTVPQPVISFFHFLNTTKVGE